jgi:hypothetical protein
MTVFFHCLFQFKDPSKCSRFYSFCLSFLEPDISSLSQMNPHWKRLHWMAFKDEIIHLIGQIHQHPTSFNRFTRFFMVNFLRLFVFVFLM